MIGCADSLALFLRGEDWPREREMYNGCRGYCMTVMKDGWDKSGAVLGPRSEEIMVSILAKSWEHHLKVSRFNTNQLTF